MEENIVMKQDQRKFLQVDNRGRVDDGGMRAGTGEAVTPNNFIGVVIIPPPSIPR